jgi:hypothetical protein
LTLPVLHTTTFSMQTAVVDQVQFEGAGTPRASAYDAFDRVVRPPSRATAAPSGGRSHARPSSA